MRYDDKIFGVLNIVSVQKAWRLAYQMARKSENFGLIGLRIWPIGNAGIPVSSEKDLSVWRNR